MKRELAQITQQHHVSTYDQLMRRVFRDPDVQRFMKTNRKQMSKTDWVRSAPRLYEYVREKQKSRRADSSSLLPGYLPQLVLNDHSVNITYQPTPQTAEQQRRQRIQDRVRSVAMPKDVRHASLNDFDYQSDNSRGVIFAAASRFVSQSLNRPNQYHRGMYIYGRFGVGKTYLLAALANSLAKAGVETTLIYFPMFALEMKDSIQTDSTSEKLRSIERSPVMMFDDVGTDTMSSWIRDDVFGVILEYRMQNELPTFFSSNVSVSNFVRNCLSTDKDGSQVPLTAKRIMERIHFLAKEYRMTGYNRRNPDLNG